MPAPVVEFLSGGRANVYFDGRLWKRTDDGMCWWWKRRLENNNELGELISPKHARVLETLYQEQLENPRKLHRFPRVPDPETISDFHEVPMLSQVEGGSDPWLVDGLIREGSTNLLAGAPGEFKTWLALVLAGAVSKGTDFLGRKTIQTPVLYLDRENPLSVIKDRREILKLADGHFLKFWGHWLKDPPPEIGDKRLRNIARREGPLIIFDAFSRFHAEDENNASKMSPVMQCLRDLVDEGATIILLHHQGKTQGRGNGFKYRGSTDISAGLDGAFALSRNEGKTRGLLTLECFKNRSVVDEFKLTIRPNLQRGRFEEDDDPSQEAAAELITKIKAAIERKRGISQQELLAVCGLPEKTGRELLQRETGRSWFTKRGKKKTLRYYLTQEETE